MTLQYNQKNKGEPENTARALEEGFTILEVLVALVIFSLTSLALFQSLGSYFVVTERVTQASKVMVEGMLSRRTLSELVDNIAPGWNRDLSSLEGGALSFSSQAFKAPTENFSPLTPFVLQIEKTNVSTDLIYISGNLKLPFYLELKGSPVFEYQSNGGIWRSNWPRDDERVPGESVNELPQAIRIKDSDSDTIFIILVLGRHRDLPEQLGLIR